MIKAIFVDIDGTLRDSNRNLSAKTIETIKRVSEKGILVILCSGRPRKYTEQISRECFASKYIITSSGGNIYDYEQDKILYVNEMNKEAIIKLLLTILSSVAQQESETISSHVKLGLKMKQQRGKLIGYNGCLGYTYDK